jgi:lysophospholipase L1-like esterase
MSAGLSVVARRRARAGGALVVALVALLMAGCRDAEPATVGFQSTAPSASATPAAPRFQRYVALGDSYTAAPGVPGQTSNDGCLRSSSNYPHLLATSLPVAQLVDVSCSGADTGDLKRAQLRGVRPQLRAVTPATDLVTIGLGGNDLDLFMRLITTCLRQDAATVTGTPCTDTLSPAVPDALDTIERNLVGAVRAVRAKAPSARVLLVGYPQILPAKGTCDEAPFARGDYAFARRVNHGLAQAVEKAARATRATYVDLWRASAGHDLCAADPWINGLDGPGAAPFHPFAAEQSAVARLVQAAL